MFSAALVCAVPALSSAQPEANSAPDFVGPGAAPTSTGPIPGSVDPLVSARTGGLPAVDRALGRLSGHRRLLMIAAHPDDEDTFVLALAARGLDAEAAYLSLSRGDGGQNLIGAETGEGLGLLRTGELESARRIDGARQFFTRAYDFGYTRSLAETLDRWPEPVLLADTMRVVRRFRPQVLVTVFPADARAGHGQHQAAGHVAERIYELSKDPAAFPELTAEGLEPWSIGAFFRASWWNPSAADLQLPLGGLDAHSGRSIFQIALESRSRHRCQDMGFEQPPGEAATALIRVDPELPDGMEARGEAGLFAGIDTSLAAMADPLVDPKLRRRVALTLERLQGIAISAREELGGTDPSVAAPALAELVRELVDLRRSIAEHGSAEPEAVGSRVVDGRAHVLALLDEKLWIAREGLAAAAGLMADAFTSREDVVPGDAFELRALFWDGDYGSAVAPHPVRSGEDQGATEADASAEASTEATGASEQVEITIEVPPGWRVGEPAASEPSRSRFAARADVDRSFRVELPMDAETTVPYFLGRSRAGSDLYDWTEVPAGVQGLPEQPAPIWARFRFELAGAPMELWREVVHRRREQALGEVRRPVRVMPALELELDRELVVWPLGRGGRLESKVDLRAHGEGAAGGSVRLEIETPSGWPAIEPIEVRLGPDGRATPIVSLEVPPELEKGAYELDLSAVWNGQRHDRALREVDYPHTRPSRLPRSANLRFVAAEIEKPSIDRIGYVRGAADRVPELLLEIGIPIELIEPSELSALDLGSYDAIVIGSRAYEIGPELAKANGRLLDYARSGGRVIVQYQQYAYVRGQLAPFDLEIARPHDRVTDETAPVRLLVPDHPILNRPHRLGSADWQGWVQERGLYFGGTWDPAWTPLLAMADPRSDGPWTGGERAEEKRGALLVSHPGEGVYIYTGLAFFRQLPAGVPGAFRLFVNLLDYGGEAEASE